MTTNRLNLAQTLEACDPNVASEQGITPQTLGEARAYAEDSALKKFDIVADSTSFVMSDDGRIRYAGSVGMFGAPFASAYMTKLATRQFVEMARVAGLNATYLFDSAPVDLTAINVNHWLQSLDRSWTWRFFGGGAEDTVARAIGGPRYNSKLDNVDLLRALSQVEKRDGSQVMPDALRVARSYVTRDSMRVQIMLTGDVEIPDRRDGGVSTYRGGVCLRNDETRRGAYRADVIAWRSACDNSIFVPDWPAYRRTHSGEYTAALAIADTLDVVAQVVDPTAEYNFDKLFDALAVAARDELSTSGKLDAIALFVDTFNLSDDAQTAILDVADAYAPSRLGLANAVTQYAQRISDPRKTDALEQAAGAYIFGKRVVDVDDSERE